MMRAMRFARHLEGWQPGLLAILIAASGAVLALPRATAPEDIPPPSVDERALAMTLQHDRDRALAIAPELEREVTGSSSPRLFDLRALGQAIRDFGLADASPNREELIVEQRAKLAEAVLRATTLGEDKLLALRSYELLLFLREVRRWEETRVESEELQALGGPFIPMLERNGWIRNGRIVPDEKVRAILFKRRWNEITGLSEGPFALTLDEQRAYYRFLLMHPSPLTGMRGDEVDCRSIDQWRLRKVLEFSQLDPEYPDELARGVLLFRLGAHLAAAEAFRNHLAKHPDGPHTLRVRNYLLAAVEHAKDDP